jgi:uncharacterized protein YbjT (DUF2867 family)
MKRKFVVIGGSGLIGRKVVSILQDGGHEVISASPSTGVDIITGKGLADALAGAHVVVDVSNAPSFEAGPVLDFFTTSTTNILSAAKAAGVGHYVALSVVGTDRLTDSGYFRAKLAQEGLIRSGAIPYSIVRATQFYEFLGAIAQSGIDGDVIHVPDAALQPMAAADVSAAVADIASGAPVNGITDIAGPERLAMADFIRRHLDATDDHRNVVADDRGRYFGAALSPSSLTPAGAARIAATRYSDWLKASKAA